MTQTGELKKTKMYCLPVLQAKNLKWRCWQGCCLVETVREGAAPGLSPRLVSLRLRLHTVSSLCMRPCLCVQMSPFYKDRVILDYGPP